MNSKLEMGSGEAGVAEGSCRLETIDVITAMMRWAYL
jgi:hypothetical protein